MNNRVIPYIIIPTRCCKLYKKPVFSNPGNDEIYEKLLAQKFQWQINR